MRLSLLLLAFGVCLQAQNRTVGFDGFAGSNPANPDPPNPLTVGVGMSFSFSDNSHMGGPIIVTDPASSPFSDLGVTAVNNGTPYLGGAMFAGDDITMAFPNGTFSMVSIDLNKLVTNDAAAIAAGYLNANTVNLIGTLASGGTVSTTFRLNGGTSFQTFTFPAGWQNLSSVKLTVNGDGTSGPNATTMGIIAVDNIVFTPVCGFSLFQNSLLQNGIPSSGRSFGVSGGGGQINISTANGCSWTVSGAPSWITIAGSGSGTGSGNVNYQVAANAGAERTGTLTIGDKTLNVEQTSALAINLANQARFAHVTSQGTWKFTLVEVNLGVGPGLGRLNFSSESGTGMFLPWTFPQSSGQNATYPELLLSFDRTLNSYAQLVMESTGPDNVPPLIGSGTLDWASGGRMGAFGIFSNPTFHWDAVVPPETRNAPSYTLAFDNTGALATGVAVSVSAGQSQDVGVIIRDATGLQIGLDTITLPSSGHISFMLFEKYPITIGKRGTIQFTRGLAGQVTVLGLRANGGALTTLPVLANVGTGGGTLSHVTYNGGFTSVMYVVNTGTSSAQFTLSFFGDTGSPLSVPLSLPQTGAVTTTSQLTRDLAPGAMLVVETQAQDALTSVAGSALLTTTGNVSAFEIFRWTTFGQEASVPLVSATPVSYALVFDNTGSLTTGVALANPSAADDNIIVIIRDELGVEIGRDTISLKGRGHTQFLLPTKYPIAAGKRGVLIITLSHFGSLSAIGLRAKADGTLTTIPVLMAQPLPLNLQ